MYNDPEGIESTAESLVTQSGSDHTILIVDNGSTDRTRSVIRRIINGRDDIQLLVEDETQGSYAARNKGIERAEGDIVAFLDADETVDEDWLETALRVMETRGLDYVGCRVELTLPKTTLVGWYNAHTGFPIEQYLEEQRYAPTCALLVRREVFDDVGPFDSRLISGGDKEFGERVHDAGYEQGYVEEAVVYHPARTSFRALAKKNVRVGRGFCQKQRYYPERYGSPGVPPTPTGSGGGEDAEGPESPFTRLAFAFLSFAMLACRGFGYYYEFLFGEKRERGPPTS
nr:glycosyltransferase [Halobaculum sp. DT92]